MNEKQAKKHGYTLFEGNYSSSSDDCMGRWYWSVEGCILDKRGRGYASKKDALRELSKELELRR